MLRIPGRVMRVHLGRLYSVVVARRHQLLAAAGADLVAMAHKIPLASTGHT